MKSKGDREKYNEITTMYIDYFYGLSVATRFYDDASEVVSFFSQR